MTNHGNVYVSMARPEAVAEDQLVHMIIRQEADGSVWAQWQRVLSRDSNSPLAHRADERRPIAATFASAMDYARKQNVGWIYVDDPHGIFTDELAAQLGCSAPMRMSEGGNA